ncbi:MULTISPECIES: type IV pilin-like G/H family protein [unclassified Coleofasciculus]|uniref:type IV pilin-like G/H family protein n=1 Tax=unclassified Coleofasciculus TaxID=2692782 RepID=UPI001882C157|nr:MULTISPECIES: type IV pilin-like G/H family protein [unclassified Coleofasciculus]MBE9126271.1 protein kinase [Coleofasciculus sp. LEGE 07081]MBE9148160.1 protein kinase [Coleofasciculus sp. LEGE 07092]
MLKNSQLLHGRYQLQTRLGQNAGRQTWLALDVSQSPSQPVIVKLLAFNPQMHWDELKLFEREAQVLKHLNHSRIPRYLDYFSVDQQAGEGLPWFGLVQEFLTGDSIQTLLDRGKRFTEKEVCQIATSVLDILIYLHELSPPVLHRDIKPSNLILDSDGQVYLVDFGAVQDRATAEGVTFTVVGTNGYAPPEQLWGRAVPASDLYALGATLIHLLTGISPADLPQRQMRIQFSDKVSLTPNFVQWLEILTEPAPERRFNSARQALLALETCKKSNSVGRQASQSAISSVRYGRLFCLVSMQLIIVGAFVWIHFRMFGGAYKAKQSEAKTYIGSMNRAQQAYYLENNTFSNSIPELELGISTQTANYNYSTHAKAKAVFNYAISQRSDVKSYVGGVFLVPVTELYSSTAEKGMTTISILCEANKRGITTPPPPTYDNGTLSCSPGTTDYLDKQEIN